MRSPEFERARRYFHQGFGLDFIKRQCGLTEHQARDLQARVEREKTALAMHARRAGSKKTQAGRNYAYRGKSQ